MAGMGNRNGNGNGGGQRGQAERPLTAGAPSTPKVGEDLVSLLLFEQKKALVALFANERDPEAEWTRCVGLAKQVYRKAQDGSDARIDEMSAAAGAIWCMRQKLDPGTDVYFVPYGGQVQTITSPQGLIKLSYRGGFVKDVIARPVFEGEIFEYELGTSERILHRKKNIHPVKPAEIWSALTHAYAIVNTTTGGKTIEVHDKSDIAYYRSLSKMANHPKGGWMCWPAEFARKAVVKQGLKWVPQSAELSAALRDTENEGVEIPEEIWDALKQKGMATPPQAQAAAKGSNVNRLTPEVAAAADARAALEARAREVMAQRQEEPPQRLKDMTDAEIEAWIRGSAAPPPDPKPREDDGTLSPEQEAQLPPQTKAAG